MHMKHFNRRNTKASKEKEECTVFTDRDFDKFEEEYDFFKWWAQDALFWWYMWNCIDTLSELVQAN